MRRLSLHQQHGYTLVELLLAMAIFSAMSVILSSGIVRLFEIYESGTSIRASQQAARLAVERISRDARAADVIAVGSDTTGTGRYNPVCLLSYQTKTTASGNQTLLTGPMYFVYNQSNSYTTGDNIGLWEQTITLPVNSPLSLASVEAGCVPPGGVSGAQQISTGDSSVTMLTASDTSGKLLVAQLSVAAANGLADVTGSGTTCNAGINARYCSVTNIDVTAGPSGGGQ